MTKNNIVSLLKSSLPLDYPILTPLLSFISLCAFTEADLILYLETLTLTDIDQVFIMKSSVFPTSKTVGITGQSDPKIVAYIASRTLLDAYIGSIGSKTRRYKETRTRHAGHPHIMRFT